MASRQYNPETTSYRYDVVAGRRGGWELRQTFSSRPSFSRRASGRHSTTVVARAAGSAVEAEAAFRRHLATLFPEHAEALAVPGSTVSITSRYEGDTLLVNVSFSALQAQQAQQS